MFDINYFSNLYDRNIYSLKKIDIEICIFRVGSLPIAAENIHLRNPLTENPMTKQYISSHVKPDELSRF